MAIALCEQAFKSSVLPFSRRRCRTSLSHNLSEAYYCDNGDIDLGADNE